MSEVYLCLHGLGPPPPGVHDPERPFWLPSERLGEIIKLARKYETATRSIRLTFDDGNKSDVSVALPILQNHGCRASFFVSSKVIGDPGYMDEADIIRLRDAGMTIGCHGVDHVRWTSLPTGELISQVRQSIEALSSIVGNSVDSVAPPFGAYNRRVLRVLREAGVSNVFTTDDREARSDAWMKPRFTVKAQTSLKEIELRFSGRLQRARRLRNWVRQCARQYL
jgi:peptidoglycan/xylan/chitin deacetylase (PgdA/CDA1 family)